MPHVEGTPLHESQLCNRPEGRVPPGSLMPTLLADGFLRTVFLEHASTKRRKQCPRFRKRDRFHLGKGSWRAQRDTQPRVLRSLFDFGSMWTQDRYLYLNSIIPWRGAGEVWNLLAQHREVKSTFPNSYNCIRKSAENYISRNNQYV